MKLNNKINWNKLLTTATAATILSMLFYVSFPSDNTHTVMWITGLFNIITYIKANNG